MKIRAAALPVSLLWAVSVACGQAPQGKNPLGKGPEVVAAGPVATLATDGVPPEAVRVCLGGPADRVAVRGALEFMAHALTESPTLASTFL